MPLVNVLAVRLEAIVSPFKAGIEEANRALQGLGKGLGSASEAVSKFIKPSTTVGASLATLGAVVAGLEPRGPGGLGGLGKGFTSASQAVSQFIKENSTLGAALGNLKNKILSIHPALAIVVLAFGALAVAISRAIRESVGLAEELRAVSLRTGVSIEALSELKFVAEQNETSFNALQIGLRFLNRNIGLAASGSLEASQAFKTLGISVRDSEGKIRSTEDVLADVADGLERTGSASLRTSRGMALLGRGSQQLIPFLAKGSQAISQARREAIAFGAQISTTFANEADEYSDNLGKLRTLQRAFGIQLAQAVIPALNNLTVALFPLIKDSLPAFGKLLGNVAFWASKAAAALQLMGVAAQALGAARAGATVTKELKEREDRLVATLFESRDAFDARAQAMVDAVPVTKTVSEETEDLGSALKQLADGFDEAGRKTEEGVIAVVALGQKYIDLGIFGRKNLDDLLTRLRAMVPASDDAARALNLITKAQEEAGAGAALEKGQELTRRRILARIADEERRKEEEAYQARRRAGVMGPAVLTLQVPEIDLGPIERVRGAWEEALTSMTDITRDAFQGFAGFVDQFAQAITSGADLGKVKFGELFMTILRGLARSIVRALILRTILSFFGFGGGFASFFTNLAKDLGFDKTQGQQLPFESAVMGRTAIARRDLAAAGAPAAGGGGFARGTTVIIREATRRTWAEIVDRDVVPRLRQRRDELNEDAL